MATTSLWHIKGSLKDLVVYVDNPEKTTPDGMRDFFQVFSYAANETKTDGFVTAINCLKEIALQQMILTKKQYAKEDKYIAWHGYQSFKPGEVTAAQCHQVGVQTATELWGERFQVIVTTHLDKGHLHNHFCFNSVSFMDGGKYNYSKAERRRMMEVSDRICREHGLSLVERPGKAPSRPIWLDEQDGKPTRYNVYREDVLAAITGSRSPAVMERYLKRKGYITDFTGQHWKLRLPQYEHFTRLDTLDKRWTPAAIQRHMGGEARFGNRPATVSHPTELPQEYREWYELFRRTSQIYRLYLFYCYHLGVLPEKTTYRPTSPYLKEELRKLHEISNQVRYMDAHKIETLEDLHADRKKLQGEMARLCDYRYRLQNKIRRASPDEKVTLRKEKAGITAQITDLRLRQKLNTGIEIRSVKIQDNLDILYANERQAKHIGRESRTR